MLKQDIGNTGAMQLQICFVFVSEKCLKKLVEIYL